MGDASCVCITLTSEGRSRSRCLCWEPTGGLSTASDERPTRSGGHRGGGPGALQRLLGAVPARVPAVPLLAVLLGCWAFFGDSGARRAGYGARKLRKDIKRLLKVPTTPIFCLFLPFVSLATHTVRNLPECNRTRQPRRLAQNGPQSAAAWCRRAWLSVCFQPVSAPPACLQPHPSLPRQGAPDLVASAAQPLPRFTDDPVSPRSPALRAAAAGASPRAGAFSPSFSSPFHPHQPADGGDASSAGSAEAAGLEAVGFERALASRCAATPRDKSPARALSRRHPVRPI